MTTVTGVVLVGGGQPAQGATGTVSVDKPAFLASGAYLLPGPGEIVIDETTGAWSIAVQALPAGRQYVFRFESRFGELLDERAVTVPASGTVQYSDL